MTNGTQGLIYRIISVSLFKRFLAAVMTAETERGLRLHQKVFLVRTVGGVAGGATFWPYFVDHFLFIIFFFVALQASFIPFCFQQVTGLRSMGIVTLDAVSSFQSGMDTGLI